MKKEYNYHFYAYLGAALSLAVILVFGIFSALQPTRMATSAMEVKNEAITRGAEVFARDCATCHGVRGEGVRNSGPALNTQEFLKEASDALIFNTIADGRPGTSMPAWGQARGGPYTAQIVEDLVAFIRSWQDTAPSIEELAYQGDPLEGAVLFSTTCYACHGVSGEGAAGPRLNEPALLEKYDDEYFRQVIANGRPDRGMPTWGSVLSPTQIEDLVAYIRSWQKEVPVAIAELGGDVDRGESIFASTCVACHGPRGSGTSIAPRLAEAPILSDPNAVYATISEGRLEAGMPSWGQVLSPAEINDVIAYLDALKAGAIAEGGGSVANGARLYADGCVTCHGLSGEGIEGLGSPLRPSDFVAGADDAILADLVLSGHGEMPAQANILSEQEINDLIALLRSWQAGAPTATPLAEDTLLKDAQLLFVRNCATCHGMSGEGRDGPALVANEFVQSSDDQAILNIIADGRANTAMEGFAGRLTEEEMLAITQLLRSWQ